MDDSDKKSTSISLLVAHFTCGVITAIIVSSFFGMFENVSQALAFYGVYHRYGWNQVIHFFGVPGIFWSLFIFMVHVKLPVVGDYAVVLSIAYTLFYISIDPIGGILYAPIIYFMYVTAIQLYKLDQKVAAADINVEQTSPCWYGTTKILKFSALVHFLSWFLQIQLGHGIIEGAQPASLESLGGALTVAPLFAFYEGLWLLGINQGLQESTQVLVDQYTNEICAAGKIAMKACQNIST
jgi:uncharacterized membrane protein YGL010W